MLGVVAAPACDMLKWFRLCSGDGQVVRRKFHYHDSSLPGAIITMIPSLDLSSYLSEIPLTSGISEF